MDKKPFYRSKTLIVNAAVSVLTLIPGVREFIAMNPETSAMIVSLINIGLRSLTGEPITVKIFDKKI